MDFETMDSFLRSFSGVEFDYPFDEKVRVYRVGEKIFALSEDTHPLRVNLKCDPIYALELRSLYAGITAGYHMNKKHWNSVSLEKSDVDEETIKELMRHSYALIFSKLSKKKRDEIEALS
jgi:predicted DNA-binding protein (MmcQ/YjbR family)